MKVVLSFEHGKVKCVEKCLPKIYFKYHISFPISSPENKMYSYNVLRIFFQVHIFLQILPWSTLLSWTKSSKCLLCRIWDPICWSSALPSLTLRYDDLRLVKYVWHEHMTCNHTGYSNRKMSARWGEVVQLFIGVVCQWIGWLIDWLIDWSIHLVSRIIDLDDFRNMWLITVSSSSRLSGILSVQLIPRALFLFRKLWWPVSLSPTSSSISPQAAWTTPSTWSVGVPMWSNAGRNDLFCLLSQFRKIPGSSTILPPFLLSTYLDSVMIAHLFTAVHLPFWWWVIYFPYFFGHFFTTISSPLFCLPILDEQSSGSALKMRRHWRNAIRSCVCSRSHSILLDSLCNYDAVAVD